MRSKISTDRSNRVRSIKCAATKSLKGSVFHRINTYQSVHKNEMFRSIVQTSEVAIAAAIKVV